MNNITLGTNSSRERCSRFTLPQETHSSNRERSCWWKCERKIFQFLSRWVWFLYWENLHSFYYNAGMYFTGDWAYRDIDGDYQIVGRKDDIVRIKGIWIQVPEIECSIVVCTTLRLALSFEILPIFPEEKWKYWKCFLRKTLWWKLCHYRYSRIHL